MDHRFTPGMNNVNYTAGPPIHGQYQARSAPQHVNQGIPSQNMQPSYGTNIHGTDQFSNSPQRNTSYMRPPAPPNILHQNDAHVQKSNQSNPGNYLPLSNQPPPLVNPSSVNYGNSFPNASPNRPNFSTMGAQLPPPNMHSSMYTSGAPGMSNSQPVSSGPPRMSGSPHMGGPPQISGSSHISGPPRMSGSPHMGGPPQISGSSHIGGPPRMSGSPHMGGPPHVSGPPSHTPYSNSPSHAALPPNPAVTLQSTQRPMFPGHLPPMSMSTNTSNPMRLTSPVQGVPPTLGVVPPPSGAPRPVASPFAPSGFHGGMHGSVMNDKDFPVDLTQIRDHVWERIVNPEPLSFNEGASNQPLVPPNQKNCLPDVFRCTLNGIPNSQTLLNKVKLPLGLIIHPFKDLSALPVISAGSIVRCKRCRAYINPFVEFLDERRWRCNLCFAVNDVTEDFLHHPVTKTYGMPHTRPECTNSTIEFIAPQEYMVRPPQPAVYMYLFDVSHSALETGYLEIVCNRLLKHLDYLPGDKRTKIGFITYDGNLHFYRLGDSSSQPAMLVVSDLDDVFLPIPDSLLVNLHENKDLIIDLLEELPRMHSISDNIIKGQSETESCLGSALEAAFKLMSAYGGRITVFQQTIPSAGHGALSSREDPNKRAGNVSTASLNPSTDFYKKMALEFSGRQIAADLFFLNSQYIDIATISCAARFSAGNVHYYPHLHVKHNPVQAERLKRDLDRYLTRKIGLEAVMRIRCTKGLAISAFHGNFFVRSTDLLALANISPDSGFGLNLCIEDDMSSFASTCIQAALLYTSSKGERRIRVHTMKFPIVKSAIDVFKAVDSDAVVCLLSKMAVERSLTSSLSDAREALTNAVVDALKAYKECVGTMASNSAILVPKCMKPYPLGISCLLKHIAFRGGVSTRLDDRVFAMIDMKSQPLAYALQTVHPNLYRIDNLADQDSADFDGTVVPQPDQLPLSAASLSREGVYLLDCGWNFFIHVTPQSSKEFLTDVLGVQQFSNIEQPMYGLPELENPMSEMVDCFLQWLKDQRPHYAPTQVIRSDTREHHMFMKCMRLDKTESSLSYQEFLQHIQQKLSK